MGMANNISATSIQQNQPVPLVPTPSSSSGISFKDVFDAINPLEHIPVVSSMYRAATGQTISTGSKIVGDVIYGAALGGGGALAIASSIGSTVADTAVQEVSGTGIGGHILNTLTGNSTNTSTPSATNTPATPANTGATQAASSITLFPYDKNPAMTAAQYHHAQILDTANQQLLSMVS